MDENETLQEEQATEATTEEGSTETTEKPEVKYTDKDVDEIVQKRIARERTKMEREIRKQVEADESDKRTEAEKLQGMTDLQKAQYEAKKLREEKAALERERDFSAQTAIARKELAAADIALGDDLLTMFVSSDAEKTAAAIEQIKELWPKAVGEAVQKALKREIPPAPQDKPSKSFAAEFAKQYSEKKNAK